MKVYKVGNRRVSLAEFLEWKMAQEILIAYRFENQLQTQLNDFGVSVRR